MVERISMNGKRLRVLCIDSEPDHITELQRILNELPGRSFDFHTCHDGATALAHLSESEFDFVFLDHRLGGEDSGLTLLRQMRVDHIASPVIVVTSDGDEYVAATVTRAGADEYLKKQHFDPDHVTLALNNARRNADDRLEDEMVHARLDRLETLSRALAESNAQISIDARLDMLTGLFIRRAWEEAATIEHERALRYGHSYSILMIDIDHFKKFNDTAGHQAGDDCLARVAEVVRKTCRTMDLPGRYGGEEFVILAPETPSAGSVILARRILEAVREAAIPHPGLGPDAIVTVSVGVSAGPADVNRWEDVLRNADELMYMAKDAGRNRVATPSQKDAA